MVLRLRRLFSVQLLLKNNRYSNKEFKLFLNGKGLNKELVEKFFDIYQSQRDERKTKALVSIEEAEKLYELTKSEIEKLKKVLQNGIKKKAP